METPVAIVADTSSSTAIDAVAIDTSEGIVVFEVSAAVAAAAAWTIEGILMAGGAAAYASLVDDEAMEGTALRFDTIVMTSKNNNKIGRVERWTNEVAIATWLRSLFPVLAAVLERRWLLVPFVIANCCYRVAEY